jgi:aminoglycoside phosphotransferase family enzyme/predicted kinase
VTAERDVLAGLRASLGPTLCALRETHMSWVLLTADRAYKLKKPVRFDFLDLREPPARRRACEEEVRVNQALAADVVLGVRAVIPREGGFDLAPGADAADAVDWVVEMRRFDEDRTMASVVARGALRQEDVVATACRIAAFHATAERAAPEGWAGLVARSWAVNVDELERAAGRHLDADRTAAARRFASGVARRRGTELDRRAAAGLVVDGHGDLRAEHVVLDAAGVTVVDRLEFDADLRRVDVADDLAFLVMDLRSLGADAAAGALVDAYRDAGGDPGDDALVAAFTVYRALVRAKVGVLRAAQVDGEESQAAIERALGLVALAERLAWEARGPVVLVIAGPPASGKSTVAAALHAAGGLPVLSSDVVRKQRAGVAEDRPAGREAYTSEARARIYAELGARAAVALRRGSVVVDATFGDPAHRDAFLGALTPPDRERVRLVTCEAPSEVRLARARTRTDAKGSDAGPEVAARLAGGVAELPVAPPHRLALDTTGAGPHPAEAVAAWLDAAP